MDMDQLWRALEQAIRMQEKADGGRPDEFVVFTSLRQRRRNIIRLQSGELERLSDGTTSKPQKITKADVFSFAHSAMNAPTGRYCIKDPNIKPGRMGSIICTLLALLPEFEYEPGQILVYRGQQHPLPWYKRLFRRKHT